MTNFYTEMGKENSNTTRDNNRHVSHVTDASDSRDGAETRRPLPQLVSTE
jgi:hypothetical protein